MFFNKGVVAMMITLAAATSVDQVAAAVRKTQKADKKTGAITPAPIPAPTPAPVVPPSPLCSYTDAAKSFDGDLMSIDVSRILC